jgi:hypothetical protein
MLRGFILVIIAKFDKRLLKWYNKYNFSHFLSNLSAVKPLSQIPFFQLRGLLYLDPFLLSAYRGYGYVAALSVKPLTVLAREGSVSGAFLFPTITSSLHNKNA